MKESITADQARAWIIGQVEDAEDDYLVTILRFFLTVPLPELSDCVSRIPASDNFVVEADPDILESIIEDGAS